MQYYPKRQNKHALLAVVLLYTLAVVCMIGSAAVNRYAALWQLASVGTAMAGIMLTNRFLLSNYLYILTPPDQLHVCNYFTVIRVLGKKRRTVAKIDLRTVRALVPASELKQMLKKRDGGRAARVSYCVDLFAENAWALLSDDGERSVVVLMQCDPSFIKEIKTRIPKGE